jgi:hypothetical protein
MFKVRPILRKLPIQNSSRPSSAPWITTSIPAPPSPTPSALFSVAADASCENLITNSYEAFSVNAMLLDLSEELIGKTKMWRYLSTN